MQIFGKFFLGWREEARTAKKLKSLITQFFKICIQRLRLTPQACMAFFNVSVLPDWQGVLSGAVFGLMLNRSTTMHLLIFARQ